jgi:hypothetical protein
MRNATYGKYAGGLMLIATIAAGSWWLHAETSSSGITASNGVSNADFESTVNSLSSRIDTLEARHNDDASHIDSLINKVTALRAKVEAPKPLPTRRDFEVSEDQAREVIPGVHMTISHTDVEHQQVSGWLYLQNEHRVLWLKNHGLLRPITVYGVDDNKPRDIVLTRVHNNDAVGYVLTAAN